MAHKESSKYMRVLNKLKADGRVSNWDLNKIAFRYGSIIFDLRKAGHNILTVCVDNQTGHYDYVWKGKDSVETTVYAPLPEEPKSRWFSKRKQAI